MGVLRASESLKAFSREGKDLPRSQDENTLLDLCPNRFTNLFCPIPLVLRTIQSLLVVRPLSDLIGRYVDHISHSTMVNMSFLVIAHIS